ncbi:uncharacterized protein BX663DRAFT_520635 [Cokeromyces recurvatus]|uniref:uncharacterized protein n=1 Tax=Cokeromyces recurvatus TaxID=90255 RepID=UPI00221E8EF4|nr:uncharacterized protein BX663DRAFT_520635 [Cokeromyces recurvatus]KAI7899593.1 hypothetical protein BX663DRAFT_520635 [Cokeromyces recurvatus]
MKQRVWTTLSYNFFFFICICICFICIRLQGFEIKAFFYLYIEYSIFKVLFYYLP